MKCAVARKRKSDRTYRRAPSTRHSGAVFTRLLSGRHGINTFPNRFRNCAKSSMLTVRLPSKSNAAS